MKLFSIENVPYSHVNISGLNNTHVATFVCVRNVMLKRTTVIQVIMMMVIDKIGVPLDRDEHSYYV